jgi:hypothetical protein
MAERAWSVEYDDGFGSLADEPLPPTSVAGAATPTLPTVKANATGTVAVSVDPDVMPGGVGGWPGTRLAQDGDTLIFKRGKFREVWMYMAGANAWIRQ